MSVSSSTVTGERLVATALHSSCGLAFFVFGMTSAIIGPTIGELAGAIGVSVAIAGILRSGRQIGQLAGFLALGHAADRFNLRLLAFFGAIAMAAGLLMVTSKGIIIATCAALVWGLGHSAYNLAPNVVIGRVFTTRAPAIMTTLHGVYGLGAMFGPWFVELFRSQGVQFIYMTSAIMVAGAGMIYAVSTKKLSQNIPVHRNNGRSGSGKISMKRLLPFLAGVLLFSGANFAASDWLYYHARTLGNASAPAAALATSAFWFALTAGRFLLGIATSRFGERAVIRASVICSMTGSIILALPLAPITLITIAAMFLGLGLAAVYPILIASAANIYPEHRGSVTGYMAAAGAFGAIVLPAFQGWLTSEKGVGMIIVLLTTGMMSLVLWSLPVRTASHDRIG